MRRTIFQMKCDPVTRTSSRAPSSGDQNFLHQDLRRLLFGSSSVNARKSPKPVKRPGRVPHHVHVEVVAHHHTNGLANAVRRARSGKRSSGRPRCGAHENVATRALRPRAR